MEGGNNEKGIREGKGEHGEGKERGHDGGLLTKGEEEGERLEERPREEGKKDREGRDYNHIKEEEGKRRNGNEGKGKGGIWKKREMRSARERIHTPAVLMITRV